VLLVPRGSFPKERLEEERLTPGVELKGAEAGLSATICIVQPLFAVPVAA